MGLGIVQTKTYVKNLFFSKKLSGEKDMRHNIAYNNAAQMV